MLLNTALATKKHRPFMSDVFIWRLFLAAEVSHSLSDIESTKSSDILHLLLKNFI
jgi:hypothetical protein